MKIISILILLIGLTHQADAQLLFIGNCSSICIDDSNVTILDQLPENLSDYSSIFLFSNATSVLSETDIDTLIRFTNHGGGLYIGAENWPLQAESKLITQRIFQKESFGTYYSSFAEAATYPCNLKLDTLTAIPAGNSTVAFPLDHRLKVEAWVDDQPLILSGELGDGKIIIDGGYSRFYCPVTSEESQRMLEQFISYLSSN